MLFCNHDYCLNISNSSVVATAAGNVLIDVCLCSYLILELLHFRSKLFRLLNVVPFGLTFGVEYLQDVQMLLFQLFLLLQNFAETLKNRTNRAYKCVTLTKNK